MDSLPVTAALDLAEVLFHRRALPLHIDSIGAAQRCMLALSSFFQVDNPSMLITWLEHVRIVDDQVRGDGVLALAAIQLIGGTIDLVERDEMPTNGFVTIEHEHGRRDVWPKKKRVIGVPIDFTDDQQKDLAFNLSENLRRASVAIAWLEEFAPLRMAALRLVPFFPRTPKLWPTLRPEMPTTLEVKINAEEFCKAEPSIVSPAPEPELPKPMVRARAMDVDKGAIVRTLRALLADQCNERPTLVEESLALTVKRAPKPKPEILFWLRVSDLTLLEFVDGRWLAVESWTVEEWDEIAQRFDPAYLPKETTETSSLPPSPAYVPMKTDAIPVEMPTESKTVQERFDELAQSAAAIEEMAETPPPTAPWTGVRRVKNTDELEREVEKVHAPERTLFFVEDSRSFSIADGEGYTVPGMTLVDVDDARRWLAFRMTELGHSEAIVKDTVSQTETMTAAEVLDLSRSMEPHPVKS